jgi:hypothetical protein
VVSFKPRPLNARERVPGAPLVRRLGGSQSPLGRRGEESSRPAPVAIPTELSRLHYLDASTSGKRGKRGTVVDLGTILEAGRSKVPFPMRTLDFLNLCHYSSRTSTLESTQFLTEISAGDLPVGQGRTEHNVNNVTVICELILYTK